MISYNAVFNISGDTLLFPEILDGRAVIAALVDGLQVTASPHHHSVPSKPLCLSISLNTKVSNGDLRFCWEISSRKVKAKADITGIIGGRESQCRAIRWQSRSTHDEGLPSSWRWRRCPTGRSRPWPSPSSTSRPGSSPAPT